MLYVHKRYIHVRREPSSRLYTKAQVLYTKAQVKRMLVSLSLFWRILKDNPSGSTRVVTHYGNTYEEFSPFVYEEGEM